MKATPKILLTFDVEEFDTALEYGNLIDLSEQIEVSTRGMKRIGAMLERCQVPATLFTTANYALHQPELMRQLAHRHEIASHGYWHGTFEPADLASSKQVLEDLTSQQVVGFRRARMMPVEETDLRAAGYLYNSSLNPTYLPGRYSHLDKPKTPFVKDSILNIPASVSPTLRIPLFWLSFKNFPMLLYKQLSINALRAHGFLNIYFHPWEFTDLSTYQMPEYVRRYAKEGLIERLEAYIGWLKGQGEFTTMRAYAAQLSS